MSKVRQLSVPHLKDLEIEFAPPDRIRLSGTLTLGEEIRAVSEFFGQLHAAALEGRLAHLHVDVSGLTFVNSLAVRLFVDWASWIIAEPHERRYGLRFLIHPEVTWQKTSVMALMEVARGVVAVEHVR